MIEKTFREISCNNRARSRVMGLVNPVSTVPAINVSKPLSYLCESFIPSDTLEFTRSFVSKSLERIQKTGIFIEPYPVVADGTFGAKRSPRRRMLAIAFYLKNLPVSLMYNHAASVITVPWAGSLDPLFIIGHADTHT